MNMRRIHLESDCLVAVREIHKEDFLCEWNSILMDILELSLDYDFFVISHVSRKVNGLAHNLAKLEFELGDYKIWRNSLPLMICNPDSLST